MIRRNIGGFLEVGLKVEELLSHQFSLSIPDGEIAPVVVMDYHRTLRKVLGLPGQEGKDAGAVLRGIFRERNLEQIGNGRDEIASSICRWALASPPSASYQSSPRCHLPTIPVA